MRITRLAAATVLALALGGCSFLSGSTSPSPEPTATLTAGTSDTSAASEDTAGATGSPSDPTASQTPGASDTSPATSDTSSEGTQSPTSSLSDPAGSGPPSTTSTLADPTGSAQSLPLTVRSAGSAPATATASILRGTTALLFRATCGSGGQLVVEYTTDSATRKERDGFKASPCNAGEGVGVEVGTIPNDATRITVTARTEPAGEFWLVVTRPS